MAQEMHKLLHVNYLDDQLGQPPVVYSCQFMKFDYEFDYQMGL